MDFNLFSKNSVLSPQDRKQRLMAVALAAVILVIIAVLYFGFWRSPASQDAETFANSENFIGDNPLETGAAEKDIIEKIDFDADFLKDSYFQTLKIYGKWPLQANERGRTNPFLPY